MKKCLLVVTGFLILVTLASQIHASDGYIPVTDAKLYYQKIGKGIPVVILHGGPGLDSSYLLPQMKKLGEKYQVVFYDQRGSGKSFPTQIDVKYFKLNQFVSDLEHVRQTLGYKKMVLVGHSWGSMLAIAYAIKYPQHTTALILMNSVPLTSAGFTAFTKEVEKRIKPISNQMNEITQSTAFMQGSQKAFSEYCRLLLKTYLYKKNDVNKLSLNFYPTTAKNQVKIEALFTKELFEKYYDFRPELKKLHIPTLVIHGDVDPVPLWTAQQITNAISQAQLVVIKKSGHFSYVEKEMMVFSAITAFIKKRGVY